jgi:hypothetical protein
MKKLLFAVVLLAPVTLLAQSPFDGTWITKLDSAQFPQKPQTFTLNKGMYECATCVPKYAVKADGTDQKVTGHPYYDTLAARVVDASSIEIIQKKDGKTMYTQTHTVSPDGNTLTSKFTDQTETQPVTSAGTSTRVSKGPAGSHAVSGSWRLAKINDVSSNGLKVTYQSTPDGMKMSDLNGQSYDAKYDGKFVPVTGDPAHAMVSVKRISANTIEETYQVDGKITGVNRMTVAPDGKSINVEYTDKLQDTTTKFTMEKQS